MGPAASTGAVGVLGPPGGVPGTVSALPPDLAAVPTSESAGPMVMRRLTNREYSHVMADLLGDTSDPGANLPFDGPTETGFEAPNAVTDPQVASYLTSADALVDTALARGLLLSNTNLPAGCLTPAGAEEKGCADQFITAFGGRAFRRPIEADERADLQGLFAAARGLGFEFQAALAEMAKGMLQSPSFLYHWEVGATPPTVDAASGLVALSPWQVAARLASTLWETTPDDTLAAAAAAGQLATPGEVGVQVDRMLADPRATRALVHFHEQLLIPGGSLGILPTLTKSSPAFTAAVAQALPEEMTRFLSSVILTGDGTLKTLLTAPYAFVNADLAPIYGLAPGIAPPAGTGFTQVSLDPTKRGGLLTQVAFLAVTGNDVRGLPAERGSIVYQKLLCGSIAPPPPAVPPLPTPTTGFETERQILTEATMIPCATACHAFFNPPGFAFGNYDGLGAYRTTDAGFPVDATGTLLTPGQGTLTFTDALDLTRQLAAHPEVRWCLDRQWFRYMLGRLEVGAEQGSLEAAYRSAAATDGYSLRALLRGMSTSKAFLARAPSPGELP
jgi:hypothetical protein